MITETFSTLFLSVSPSVHPSQALALPGEPNKTYLGKTNNEGLYVTETHSEHNQNKHTENCFPEGEEKEKEAEMMHDGEGLEYR